MQVFKLSVIVFLLGPQPSPESGSVFRKLYDIYTARVYTNRLSIISATPADASFQAHLDLYLLRITVY